MGPGMPEEESRDERSWKIIETRRLAQDEADPPGLGCYWPFSVRSALDFFVLLLVVSAVCRRYWDDGRQD